MLTYMYFGNYLPMPETIKFGFFIHAALIDTLKVSLLMLLEH